MQLIQIAVAALVALILGLFVVRPILTNSGTPAIASDLDRPTDLLAMDGATAPLTIEQQPGTVMGAADTGNPADPVERLRTMISERETETVQILQDWIQEPSSTERA